ncbi:MAG: LPS export ABC transporter periplasmic protein LptC [Pseudomonadota bacterium]
MPRLPRRLLLLAGVAIIALWLLGRERPGESDTDQPRTSVSEAPPESWSRGLRTTQYAEDGQVRYVLEASEQTQEAEGRITVTAPLVRLYDGDRQHWQARAASGTILDSGATGARRRQLDLTDEVQVDYTDENGRDLVLTTQQMTVYPDDEVLFSNVAVVVRGTGFEQTSAGMRAALEQEQLTFFGRVQGRFHDR